MDKTYRYDYLATRDAKVLISFKGRIVKVLKGADARQFLDEAKSATAEAQQELLHAAARPLTQCG